MTDGALSASLRPDSADPGGGRLAAGASGPLTQVPSSSLGPLLACRASAVRTKRRGLGKCRAGLRQNRPVTRNDRCGLRLLRAERTPGEALGRTRRTTPQLRVAGRLGGDSGASQPPRPGLPLVSAPGASESDQGPSSAGGHVLMVSTSLHPDASGRPGGSPIKGTRGRGDRLRLLRA